MLRSQMSNSVHTAFRVHLETDISYSVTRGWYWGLCCLWADLLAVLCSGLNDAFHVIIRWQLLVAIQVEVFHAALGLIGFFMDTHSHFS